MKRTKREGSIETGGPLYHSVTNPDCSRTHRPTVYEEDGAGAGPARGTKAMRLMNVEAYQNAMGRKALHARVDDWPTKTTAHLTPLVEVSTVTTERWSDRFDSWRGLQCQANDSEIEGEQMLSSIVVEVRPEGERL